MKEVIFKVTRSIEKKREEKWCAHRLVTVDEHQRIVYCRECNAVIDPFNYILGWALDQNRYEMEVEYKKRELTDLFNKVAELKKTVSYLKRKEKDCEKIKNLSIDF